MAEERKMNIVIAPDSFKESLTAREAAEAIHRGWSRVFPEAEYALIPMADGGEGTVQSLIDATGGRKIEKRVTGPLGDPVPGFFGMLGDGKTAVIEMAAAAGLEYLAEDERNPLITTTFGVGELIRAALNQGARHIILGLGGSATNDAGAGMAEALGFRFLDDQGRSLPRGGAALANLATIDSTDVDPRLTETRFDLASDVTNPLTGPNGASAVFGPQKGAAPEQVSSLDQALAQFASVVYRDLGTNVDKMPGAGAAGGLGAGAICFLEGKIRPGVDLVIGETALEEKMHGATLVITGEGKIDGQTIYGKTPIGVARCAKKFGIPVIALAGYTAEDADRVLTHGIDAVFSVVPGAVPLQKALADAAANIERTAENLARLWRIAGTAQLP